MTDVPLSEEEYAARLQAAFAEIASLVCRRWKRIASEQSDGARMAAVARYIFEQSHGGHASPDEIVWARTSPEIVSPCKLPVLLQRAELAPAWAAYFGEARMALDAVKALD